MADKTFRVSVTLDGASVHDHRTYPGVSLDQLKGMEDALANFQLSLNANPPPPPAPGDTQRAPQLTLQAIATEISKNGIPSKFTKPFVEMKIVWHDVPVAGAKAVAQLFNNALAPFTHPV